MAFTTFYSLFDFRNPCTKVYYSRVGWTYYGQGSFWTWWCNFEQLDFAQIITDSLIGDILNHWAQDSLGQNNNTQNYKIQATIGPVEFGPVPGPVLVDLAGTRPIPRFFSCWIKVAKITVENKYIIKSNM